MTIRNSDSFDTGDAVNAASKQLIPVKIEYHKGPMMFRGPSAYATITGTITKVEVIYNGAVVTSIPAGAKFAVKMYFSANNPGGGNWAVAGTAVNTGTNEKHAKVDSVYLKTSTTGSFFIDDNVSDQNVFTMGSSAVTLRLKLWAYPTGSSNLTDFNAAVPQSSW
jgi:hypothetical protein